MNTLIIVICAIFNDVIDGGEARPVAIIERFSGKPMAVRYLYASYLQKTTASERYASQLILSSNND